MFQKIEKCLFEQDNMRFFLLKFYYLYSDMLNFNKFVLNCPRNLEPLVAKEIKSLWYKNTITKRGFVEFYAEIEAIAYVNLWSRIWSKLYMELWWTIVNNFSELFDYIYTIDRQKYISLWQSFKINVVNKNSQINSISSTQKIVKKSIIKKLLWWEWFYNEDVEKWIIDILIVIDNDNLSVLLNTTWESLFKRWYKVDSSIAWLKENVAAALVVLAWWKFSEPFYDFFSWAWTIPIEAAMIAKNIAPWLLRTFDFEQFDWYDKKILENARDKAKNSIYERNYNIYWYDIDDDMINVAKENAKIAWVWDSIVFDKQDFTKFDVNNIKWTFLSNPPYWIRIKSKDIDIIYQKLIDMLVNQNLSWWFYTWYDWDYILTNQKLKKKLIFNWQQEAYLFKKK